MLDSVSKMLEPPLLGPLLRERRRRLDWSLEQLAAESGVSRSMLSQIERGAANPTFATLWNVMQALGVEFDELTSGSEEEAVSMITLTPSSMLPTMTSPDDLVSLRALSPVDLAGTLSWYELEIAAHGALVSSAHAAGTLEHLTVLSGEVAVRSGTAVETVGEDHTARYRGDIAHEISNPHSTPARALLVVVGGEQ